MNLVSIDQVMNLCANVVLLAVFVAVYLRKAKTALVVGIIIVAIIQIAFYGVAIFTDINELYRVEYSQVSGFRSLLVVGILIGIGLSYFYGGNRE